MDDPPEADVRPDDRALRMALEQRLHLCVRYTGSASIFPNGMSMSLCRITTMPALSREVEHAIECGIGQAGCLAPDTFAETEFLAWMLNSPMPLKTPGNTCSTRLM